MVRTINDLLKTAGFVRELAVIAVFGLALDGGKFDRLFFVYWMSAV